MITLCSFCTFCLQIGSKGKIFTTNNERCFLLRDNDDCAIKIPFKGRRMIEALGAICSCTGT